MADVVTPEKRSQMMAGIRGKDTQPELLLRRGLHRMGFRYQLHRSDLPGKPDLLFPRYRAALFVHGCFWHGHDCHLFKWPKSREEFWRTKIDENTARDAVMIQGLRSSGWRVGTVWECALKGKLRREMPAVMDAISTWLKSDEPEFCLGSAASESECLPDAK